MANMIPISTVTVGSGGASSIDFINIPQSYTDLIIKLSLRVTASNNDNYFNLNFNNISTATYSYRGLNGNGSTAFSDTWTNQNNAYINTANGDTSTANTFCNVEIYIPNYTSGNNKSFSSDGVAESNTATASTRWNALQASIWANTSAINQVTFTPQSGQSFKQYSSATIYGIRKY